MSQNNKSSNFLIQGTILAAASILVRLIGLLYRIPMQRIVGNEGMGYYSNAFAIYNLALILSSYSLPLAVSKLVAVRNANKEHRNSYRIFLCAMMLAMAVGLLATLILFFGAGFFAKAIYDSPNTTSPLQILAPTIFVFSIMGVFRGYFQGKNTMIPTAVSQVLEQVVNAIVSVGAAWFLIKHNSAAENVAAYGAAGGTLGTFTGAFMGLLFLIFVFAVYRPVLKKQLRRDTLSQRESYQSIFKLLVITIAPVILSQTVFQISSLIDGSLFGHIMSDKKIEAFDLPVLLANGAQAGQYYSEEFRNVLMGIYSGKYALLTNVPVAVASAIGASIVTTISADLSKGLLDSIRYKVHAAIKFNMIIAIPSAVGMAVLASPILYAIFKDSYQLSANMLMLGSSSIIFYALSTMSTAVLQGINRMNVPVINSAISLGIHVVLVFVLLTFTPLSTYALVIGNVTFPLVVCILNWIKIAKYLDYRQELLRTFVIPLVSAGLMGVITYFTYKGLIGLSGSVLLSLLLSILIAVIIYFGLLIFMKGVDEDELSVVPKSKGLIRVLKKLKLL